jgi:WD40 repeat protein
VLGVTGSTSIWSDLDGDRLREDGFVSDIVADPLAPSVVVSASQQGPIDFIDAAAGRIVRSIDVTGHSDVMGLAISPSGRLLATAQSNGTIVIRNAATGAVLGAPLVLGSKPAYRLAFAPSGNLLAAGGGDGVVRLWDVGSRRLLHSWRTGANIIEQVRFDPAGDRVLVADIRSAGAAVTYDLWWASTRSDRVSNMRQIPYGVRGMVALPGDRELVGNGDGTLELTDTSLGPLPTLISFRQGSNVMALDATTDGGLVVTADGDATAAVLAGPNLDLMLRLPSEDPAIDESHTGAIYSAGITTDARFAVFGTEQGRIQIVPLDDNVLIAKACRIAGRAPSAGELGVSTATLASLGLPC